MRESFYILGYLVELIIKSDDLGFFCGEIWRIGAIFPMKNSLYWPKSYFSGRNLAKFRHKQKNTGSPLIVIHLRGDHDTLPIRFLCKGAIVSWSRIFNDGKALHIHQKNSTSYLRFLGLWASPRVIVGESLGAKTWKKSRKKMEKKCSLPHLKNLQKCKVLK
jgi:hypothetical protein